MTGLRGEIDNSIITVEDFNILLSIMDRTSRQKITKDTGALNNTLNQLDLTDSCRTLHPTTVEMHILKCTGTFPGQAVCWAIKQAT